MTVFTNISKPSTSYTNTLKKTLGYILTDDESKILVGEDEDLYLVWSTPTRYTDTTKPSTTFTNISK
jgi:hypothetical protein